MSETIYGVLDAGHHFVAFYSSDVSPPASIPAAAVAISAAVWQAALASPGGTYAAGVYTPPAVAPPTRAQLNAYANGKVLALLAAERLYSGAAIAGVALPAGVAGILCAAAPAWNSLLTINAWGLANPAATQPWTDDAYNVFTLTGAEAVTFSDAALAYGQSVYATLASAATAIASGAIATTAAIDALGWPT